MYQLLHSIVYSYQRGVLTLFLYCVYAMQGKVGKVLRSGNGWVQLMTSVGEMAKRAYELELIAPDSVSYYNIS
jgi:hypothetical protein